jgi:hypothetical protein
MWYISYNKNLFYYNTKIKVLTVLEFLGCIQVQNNV